jgi:hypothetical protein
LIADGMAQRSLGDLARNIAAEFIRRLNDKGALWEMD